jgi:hypothetical protein
MAEEKVTLTKNQKEFKSEISGKTFIFQKVTPVAWLDIMDEVEATKEKKSRKLYGEVMENIVVSPKMGLEDFEDFAEMDEVVTAAIRFQRGK